MADQQTTPICEECDLPMHPFAADGHSGWACGGCGWSHDDPRDEPPAPAEQQTTPEAPRPLDPADTARTLERSVSAAHYMALMLQGAAARPATQTHMAAAVALLSAAEDELKAAAREFVGDRVEKERASAE